MMDSDCVECPICLQSYKQISIEKHVNACLLSHEEKPNTRSLCTNIDAPSEKKGFFQRRSGKRKSFELKSNSLLKQNNDIVEKNNDNVTEKLPVLPHFVNDSCEVTKSNEKIIIEDDDIMPSIKRTKMNDLMSQKNEAEKLNAANHNISSNNYSPRDDSQNMINEQTHSSFHSLATTLPKLGEKEKPLQTKVLHSTKKDIKEKKVKLVLGKVPLAELMRPVSLEDYYGQHAVNSQKILKDLFYNDKIPSMILWGPPGCGKTSLAHIIKQSCKSGRKYRFISLSATMSGVNDVKEAIKVAKNERKLTQRMTVLFVDEVHRFNKLQQDSFLPHVEDGTIILIGATTENPSFHVNNALMSRCRVVVLSQLESESIVKILTNAVKRLDGREIDDSVKNNHEEECRFTLEAGVIKLLSNYANGDARIALNSLDIILQSKLNSDINKQVNITCDQVINELKSNHIPYDRNGDEHYHIISALHKSIRGSNVDASLYWLARMLEGGEQPLYIARRLVRCASEDIGMADPNALQQAVSAYQSYHFIGMPECDVILAQLVVYLAKAAKSISVYEGYNKAKTLVKTWTGPHPSVPLHLRNAPTNLMKNLGYGKDYKYTPKCIDKQQEYFPEPLIGTKFYDNET